MSTSLNDLNPPSSDTPSQNIMYDPNIKEQNKKIDKIPKQDDMKELINGIQENKQFLSLPSSHLPTSTDHISSDGMTQPNYIPNEPQGANIQDIEEEQFEYDYTNEGPVKNKEEKSATDKFILPIIIFLTTMALNTPMTLKYLYKLFPKIFRKDGHPQWYYSAIKGIILASIVYYFLYNN
tara:strand:- start:1364 stop:1903 length:540 start_codon:yes stop_codon:yes gene_type:complete